MLWTWRRRLGTASQLAPVAERTAAALHVRRTRHFMPLPAGGTVCAIAAPCEGLADRRRHSQVHVGIRATTIDAQPTREQAAHGHVLSARRVRERARRITVRVAGAVQEVLAHGYAVRVVLEGALGTAAAVAAAMPAEEGAEHAHPAPCLGISYCLCEEAPHVGHAASARADGGRR